MNSSAHHKTMKIGSHTIGTGSPCFVIGEVAQAHDGSLGMAHAFIDAIADANADAVKFQTHIAAAESTPSEPFRVRFGTQDKSRFDYWKRMEFTESQWQELASHAAARNLIFLSSPFSIEAVDLLDRLGMPAWKIASGEIRNTLMLDRIARGGKPVLMSTGMSGIEEIDRAVEYVNKLGVPLGILQTTSMYPCPAEKIGLNLIPFFRDRYGCPVGLSDHSGTIFSALAASALGTDILEVHVSFSRDMFGPDVPASITNIELKQLVEGIRYIEKIVAHPVDKDRLGNEMKPLRDLFMRSLVPSRDLKKGAILKENDLIAKKPGTGIPAERLPELVGMRVNRDLMKDELIQMNDLEETGRQ